LSIVELYAYRKHKSFQTLCRIFHQLSARELWWIPHQICWLYPAGASGNTPIVWLCGCRLWWLLIVVITFYQIMLLHQKSALNSRLKCIIVTYRADILAECICAIAATPKSSQYRTQTFYTDTTIDCMNRRRRSS